jgi:hypothetical protein
MEASILGAVLNSTAAYVVYALVAGALAGIILYGVGAFLGALPSGMVSALICALIGGFVVTASLLAQRERVNVAVADWRKSRRGVGRHDAGNRDA